MEGISLPFTRFQTGVLPRTTMDESDSRSGFGAFFFGGRGRLGGEIISLNCCKWLQINRLFFQAVTDLSEGKCSASQPTPSSVGATCL